MPINTPYRSRGQHHVYAVIRWILYLLLLCTAFLLQSLGVHVKPLLVIPVSVCIVMSEGVLPSAVVGALCGVMIDLSCGKLFCSNAIAMTCICVGTALLFMHLLRHNLINAVIATLLCTLVQGLLDFFFCYFMWGYESVSYAFTHYFLPSMGETVLCAVPIYLIFRKIKAKLMPTAGMLYSVLPKN